MQALKIRKNKSRVLIIRTKCGNRCSEDFRIIKLTLCFLIELHTYLSNRKKNIYETLHYGYLQRSINSRLFQKLFKENVNQLVFRLIRGPISKVGVISVSTGKMYIIKKKFG